MYRSRSNSDEGVVSFETAHPRWRFLTRHELEQGKDAYDRSGGIGRQDAFRLKSVLQEIGILVPFDVDLEQVMATMVSQTSHQYQQNHASHGDQAAVHCVHLGEFLEIMDYLKRLYIHRMADRDIDLVDAFVAMGGRHDRGGEIRLNTLKDTIEAFSLQVDVQTLVQEVDLDHDGFVDYDEFSTLLSKTSQKATEIWEHLGGNVPQNGPLGSVLLGSAIPLLIETFGVAVPKHVVERVIDEAEEKCKKENADEMVHFADFQNLIVRRLDNLFKKKKDFDRKRELVRQLEAERSMNGLMTVTGSSVSGVVSAGGGSGGGVASGGGSSGGAGGEAAHHHHHRLNSNLTNLPPAADVLMMADEEDADLKMLHGMVDNNKDRLMDDQEEEDDHLHHLSHHPLIATSTTGQGGGTRTEKGEGGVIRRGLSFVKHAGMLQKEFGQIFERHNIRRRRSVLVQNPLFPNNNNNNTNNQKSYSISRQSTVTRSGWPTTTTTTGEKAASVGRPATRGSSSVESTTYGEIFPVLDGTTLFGTSRQTSIVSFQPQTPATVNTTMEGRSSISMSTNGQHNGRRNHHYGAGGGGTPSSSSAHHRGGGGGGGGGGGHQVVQLPDILPSSSMLHAAPPTTKPARRNKRNKHNTSADYDSYSSSYLSQTPTGSDYTQDDEDDDEEEEEEEDDEAQEEEEEAEENPKSDSSSGTLPAIDGDNNKSGENLADGNINNSDGGLAADGSSLQIESSPSLGATLASFGPVPSLLRSVSPSALVANFHKDNTMRICGRVLHEPRPPPSHPHFKSPLPASHIRVSFSSQRRRNKALQGLNKAHTGTAVSSSTTTTTATKQRTAAPVVTSPRSNTSSSTVGPLMSIPATPTSKAAPLTPTSTASQRGQRPLNTAAVK